MKVHKLLKWLSVLVAAYVIAAPIAGLGTGTHSREIDPKETNEMDPSFLDSNPWDHATGLLERYLRPPRNADAVDPYLREKMDEADTYEGLEVIVQFIDEIDAKDRNFLGRERIEIGYEFTGFDAIYCMATPLQIESMNDYDRVFHIEYNEELVYHMDLSLESIKATDTWYSILQSEDGDDTGVRIDGRGITAVVLDSGVDAGHPDLDYKEKTILNLKSDTNMVWTEAENTDTSSGHGTHCAGTVAGNGDASAGARRGVAPGASLIGLSTGEAVVILNAVGALEWVYEHSKPHNNPHNIRVVSNSWGSGGGIYEPNDIISTAINKLTYENNVVCVFAAGNSGGDGTTIQSSNYGNTPAAICVAAAERDGSGIASFSSRGDFRLNNTYPDIAAPGVKIWSTAARRTLISAMTKQNADVIDPYYFAISGTSMATPHITGVVSLLWQACPSMRVSYVRDHFNETEGTDWWTRDDTRMHESEVILKASADYIDRTEGNGVPDEFLIGYFDNRYDYAQGYGLVNVRKAVALALTLQELRTRDFDGNGMPDYPNATVFDAVKQYRNTIQKKSIHYPTTSLYAQWGGEWTRFTNQTNNMDRLETDQSHYIYVPASARRMIIDLTYNTVSVPELSMATLALVVDANLDGTIDWRQNLGGLISGNKHSELTLDTGDLSKYRDGAWMFNIEGQGFDFTLLDLFQGSSYSEVMVEYDVGVEILLQEMPAEQNNITYTSTQSSYTPLEPIKIRDTHSTEGFYMECLVYDLGEVGPIEGEPVKGEEKSSLISVIIWVILAALLLLTALAVYLHKKGILNFKGSKGEE